MNIKTLIIVIIGVAVFVSIWLFSMFIALALLCGFGIGVWWHNWFIGIFDNIQKNIYLEQKVLIEKKLMDLDIEREKLKKELS